MRRGKEGEMRGGNEKGERSSEEGKEVRRGKEGEKGRGGETGERMRRKLWKNNLN